MDRQYLLSYNTRLHIANTVLHRIYDSARIQED